MADDAQKARDELAAEAARLAAKRRADEEAHQHAASRAVADRTQLDRIEHPGRLRASLFRGMFFVVGVTFIVLAPFVMFVASQPDEDSNLPGVLTRNEIITSLTIAAIGVGLVALRLTSIGRSRRWRAKLPFAIKGYEETFGLPKFVSILSVTVISRDAPIDSGVLAELVRARVPESEIHHAGPVFEIRSPDLETEAANWRGVNWFRKLVHIVLLDIHRGYPIETVMLSAQKTTEFYVPSGD